jgi:hypothetical protein
MGFASAPLAESQIVTLAALRLRGGRAQS